MEQRKFAKFADLVESGQAAADVTHGKERLKFHPAADAFPLLKGEEFAALVASIKAVGLLNPITLHPDGSILDGRNRYLACLEAGVEPRFVTWDGKGSVIAFVVAQNNDRRHQSATERALIGKELEPLFAAEAKERQRLGRPKKGEKLSSQVKGREPQARDLAAKAARTNPAYISDVKRIEREAPELYARLKAGALELPEAKRLLHKANAAAKVARPATGNMVAKHIIERLTAIPEEALNDDLKFKIVVALIKIMTKRELNAQQLACAYVILGQEVPDNLKREAGVRNKVR